MKISFSFKSLAISLLLLTAFTCLIYAPIIHAASVPIGQVLWVKGTMKAQQTGGTPRTLERRSAIFETDLIITSANSTGELVFNDSSVVTLRPNSQFKIDQFQHKAGGSGSSEKSVMTIIKGGLRTITGAVAKANPSGYQLNTPVATIGVRGTQYSAIVSNTKGLLLKIDRGEIEARNSAGKINLRKCEPNEANCTLYANVSSFDIAPTPVTQMPPEFANEPPITIAPTDLGPPLMPGQTSSAPGKSGPAKTVSNFCIS